MRKVLISRIETLQRYTSLEFWYTICVLAADYGWGVLDESEMPRSRRALPLGLRRRFGEMPEVVLFHESFAELGWGAAELADAGIRVYVRVDDLQHDRTRRTLAALRVATAVLPTYGPRLTAFFPQLQDARVVWVPHGAGPDFQLPVNDAPSPSVFVSGAMNDLYPLRMSMRDLVLRRPELGRIHGHPGYTGAFDHTRDARVGRQYADAMRQHLAAFTDCSRYLYVVAKHFEIPATGALLIADRAIASQLAELGFVDGKHYLSAGSDLEAVVERVVDPRNREEIDAIRRRGHALVHERHTTRHRAEQIDAVCT